MSLVSFLANFVVTAKSTVTNTVDSISPAAIRTNRRAKRWEKEAEKEERELGEIPMHANLFGAKHRGIVHDKKNGQIYYKRDGNWAEGKEPWDTSSLSNTKLTEAEKQYHEGLFHKFFRKNAKEIAKHKNQIGK